MILGKDLAQEGVTRDFQELLEILTKLRVSTGTVLNGEKMMFLISFACIVALPVAVVLFIRKRMF